MKWPNVKKLKFDNRDNKFRLRIIVSTQMFCGYRLELQEQNAPRNREFSIKDNLHNRINAQAKKHISGCAVCQKHYN